MRGKSATYLTFDQKTRNPYLTLCLPSAFANKAFDLQQPPRRSSNSPETSDKPQQELTTDTRSAKIRSVGGVLLQCEHAARPYLLLVVSCCSRISFYFLF